MLQLIKLEPSGDLQYPFNVLLANVTNTARIGRVTDLYGRRFFEPSSNVLLSVEVLSELTIALRDAQ